MFNANLLDENERFQRSWKLFEESIPQSSQNGKQSGNIADRTQMEAGLFARIAQLLRGYQCYGWIDGHARSQVFHAKGQGRANGRKEKLSSIVQAMWLQSEARETNCHNKLQLQVQVLLRSGMSEMYARGIHLRLLPRDRSLVGQHGSINLYSLA